MLNNLPFYLVRCLILTVIIECFLALIIGIRGKYDFAIVALVNVVTNPLVVVGTFLAGFYGGLSVRIAAEIIAELSAFAAEAFIYSKTLNYKKLNPVLVSLILNGASYTAGLIINQFSGG